MQGDHNRPAWSVAAVKRAYSGYSGHPLERASDMPLCLEKDVIGDALDRIEGAACQPASLGFSTGRSAFSMLLYGRWRYFVFNSAFVLSR
jgi:hypothetical protein